MNVHSCFFSYSNFFSQSFTLTTGLYLFQVVDVELHRNSLGEDYIPQPSSSKVTHRETSPMLSTSLGQIYGRSSSPISHDPSVDKGTQTETFVFSNTFSSPKPDWTRSVSVEFKQCWIHCIFTCVTLHRMCILTLRLKGNYK